MSTLAAIIEHNDLNFFYFLNRRLHCRALNILMRLVTQLGSTPFAVFAALFALMSGRRLGYSVLANLVMSQIMIQFVKRLVNRPRPYKTLEWVIARKPPKCTYSFPSGHSSSALSIALSLSVFFPGLRLLLLCAALLVGISRVCLGFHYPTDVSMGFVISYLAFRLTEILIM